MKIATGSSLNRNSFLEYEKNRFDIRDYGAREGGEAVANTKAIDEAIAAASQAGGGCVVVPAGDYKVYTIHLQSHIILRLEENAILRAARPDIDGGNYDMPEVNPFAGLHDQGHSYFANSLMTGFDLEDIRIDGSGRIDGSMLVEGSDDEIAYVIQSFDPRSGNRRLSPGCRDNWFANKAISLVRCRNIVLLDFAIVIGGHFAILASGCDNMYADHILLDTQRDAFDIDACKDVTVTNSIVNSLTDDGLCLKASIGAGLDRPVSNVLLEDCVVCGYDAGSVWAGEYTRNKLIAADRCGPTGRVKFGTEATGGLDTLTVRRVRFDRSRGFALEACDGSDMHDILMTDCEMEHISSSPVYIRVGDRGRRPVTGVRTDDIIGAPDNVRLDNPEWILPARNDFPSYPAVRYKPSYARVERELADGNVVPIVVQGTRDEACRINNVNLTEKDGKYYVRQTGAEISADERYAYANACGRGFAQAWNIEIRNLKVRDADPRYPILVHGLLDSRIRNVVFENVDVEFRGGLSLADACEQRIANTRWDYNEYKAERRTCTLPWMVNSFFSKNEARLPRMRYDAGKKTWVEDPLNVPEMPDVYPEPSDWGILPSYGFYLCHTEDITLRGLKIRTVVQDSRYGGVIDDAVTVRLENIEMPQSAEIVTVTSPFRRHTGFENVPELAYFTTTVTDLVTENCPPVREEKLAAPQPGVPSDSLYPYPTVAVPENGFNGFRPQDDVTLPLTVHVPYTTLPGKIKAADAVEFEVRDPAGAVFACDVNTLMKFRFPGRQEPVIPTAPRELTVGAALVCGENTTELTVEKLSREEAGIRCRVTVPEEIRAALKPGSRFAVTVSDGTVTRTESAEIA